jgi:dihydroorotate dehydrogenase (NAD+) catalytic subunit
MKKEVDLSVKIGSLSLKSPVLLASGTCGYGMELEDLMDLNTIGGIVLKGISLRPRPGNPPPRIIETPCGLLNSIGLENVGIDAFIEEKLPRLSHLKTAIIANILGESIEEYEDLSRRLDQARGVHAIEVNISCPNVKAGGVAFGTNPETARAVTMAVKKATSLPVIVKLSPNVMDITLIARAVEKGGADAISLINTILGMKIDIEKRRPVLSQVFGGLSGPAIMPVALRMVWQAVRSVNIPVIGIGGITTSDDALEFLMAGAKAIEIGTATLVKPDAATQIQRGILTFMEEKGISRIDGLHISIVDG